MELATLMDQLAGLWTQVEAFAIGLLRPRQLYQVGVLLGLIVGALVLSRLLNPVLDGWMRSRSGWEKWQLRWLITVRNRMSLILFVLFASLSVVIAQQLSPWPSTRYLLVLATTITTAWLVVALLGRLIANNTVRKIARWFAWIYVTLHYTNLLEPTKALLDNFALEVGDFRLSVLAMVTAIVVTSLLVIGARLISSGATNRIRMNEDISPSMQVLLVKAMQVFLYAAAFFIGLKAVGFDLTGLAVLSGAIGVGLGFGLQKVVSNLVSGVIILLDKSVKPGDVISLGDTFGWIQTLGARYASVVTRDGKEYLIPNEDLITGQVVNWSHSNDFVRLDIFFGTAYDDDPHKVRALAVSAAAAVPRVLVSRAPVCHIVGFGDSSVDYILRFWISDPTGGLTNIRGAVFLALWDAFKEAGVSIPFPQREVRLLDTARPTVPD